MYEKFIMDGDLDICLLPYGELYEQDTLEIRAQAYNDGAEASVYFNFLLDGITIGKKHVHCGHGSFAYANIKIPLQGMAGKHAVCVCLESEDNRILISNKETEINIESEKPIHLDGGFVMFAPPLNRVPCDTFNATLRSFTDDTWKKYTDACYGIGMDTIILTTVYQYYHCYSWGEAKENIAELRAPFEGSKLWQKNDNAARDPIEVILCTADGNNQKVFLAVGNNYGYGGTTDEVDELYMRYRKHKSFYGWYMALELPLNIRNADELQSWHKLEQLSEYAHSISPVKPVLISPYEMPSKAFLEYYNDATCFDIMMPQDWVGQKRFSLEQSRTMYRRLYEICQTDKRHLWANCEGFNFVNAREESYPYPLPTQEESYLVPRFRDGGIIGAEGFDKQMAILRPYVEKITTFMLTGFFNPPDFEPFFGEAAEEAWKSIQIINNPQRI